VSCANSFVFIFLFRTVAEAATLQAARRAKRQPADLGSLVSSALNKTALVNPKKKRAAMETAGLTRWADSMLANKRAQLVSLVSKSTTAVAGGPALTGKETKELEQLALAIKTQEHTLVVHAAGLDAAAAFADTTLTKLERLTRAFAFAAAANPSRIALYFNDTRLTENAKSARARQRALDVSVNRVISFACASTPRNIDGSVKRIPVLYVGDRVNSRKASRGFAMKRFLHLLSRKAIVVVCSEFRTTKCCSDCGRFNLQPRKAYSAMPHRGTMYCANRACPSQGRFTNRDVQAACNIVDRFICAFVLGGKLGLLSGGGGRMNCVVFLSTSHCSIFGGFFCNFFYWVGGFSEFARTVQGQPARPLSFFDKFRRPAQPLVEQGQPMQL
jgi:hypothetical protein